MLNELHQLKILKAGIGARNAFQLIQKQNSWDDLAKAFIQADIHDDPEYLMLTEKYQKDQAKKLGRKVVARYPKGMITPSLQQVLNNLDPAWY